jgi:bifunctional non-homologous end joining protein LigD
MTLLKPMMATPGTLPSGPGWAYEVKWDGFRAIHSQGRYHGRSGLQMNGPPLPDFGIPIDGELVAFDSRGLPSINLMHGALLPFFIAFDVVVPDLPYEKRRELLEELDLTISPRFTDREATVAAAKELGLEGVVAKKLGSYYLPGVRSPDWIKEKFVHTGDFVVGGWWSGQRKLGSLLVGNYTEKGLEYRGKVGGGITATTEAALLPVLQELARSDSPFAGPTERGNYVEPLLVVEVKYAALTPDRRLRFPIFLRLRPDKLPMECLDEG